MFKLILSPTRGNAPRTLERKGMALIVDGEAFDFSRMREGDTLPQSAVTGGWLNSDVTVRDGALTLTVMLPHGINAPHETRFPESLTITADGPVDLPPYDAPEGAE
jgi:hypothetical protein